MITLSFNFDKAATKANRGSHEQKIRDIVDTHLSFPGSDKLKMGVNIKNNGATTVSFTGPQEAIAEAKRLWKENVKPVAKKVKLTAKKVKRAATHATKPAKKWSKAAAPKRTHVRTKAKESKSTTRKRKA